MVSVACALASSACDVTKLLYDDLAAAGVVEEVLGCALGC